MSIDVLVRENSELVIIASTYFASTTIVIKNPYYRTRADWLRFLHSTEYDFFYIESEGSEVCLTHDSDKIIFDYYDVDCYDTHQLIVPAERIKSQLISAISKVDFFVMLAMLIILACKHRSAAGLARGLSSNTYGCEA